MSNAIQTIGNYLSKNSPQILTGVGAAGVLGTAVLAVRATPKALRDIWDAESEQTEGTGLPEVLVVLL